jgi:hypothetical protein
VPVNEPKPKTFTVAVGALDGRLVPSRTNILVDAQATFASRVPTLMANVPCGVSADHAVPDDVVIIVGPEDAENV